jgi:hypothetical protein
MHPRIKAFYQQTIIFIFDYCDDKLGKYGFDRSELLKICKQNTMNSAELNSNYKTVEQIQKRVEKLCGFSAEQRSIQNDLSRIKAKLDICLKENKTGYPNPDRVLFGVMRYFIHFNFEGEALYLLTVGVSVYTGAIKASDFKLREDHPSYLFDVFGKVPNKKRLMDQVRKRFDRICEKYDHRILDEWTPKYPIKQLPAVKPEDLIKMIRDLNRQIRDFEQISEAEGKNSRREVTKEFISKVKSVVSERPPTKRRRIK